MGLHKLLLNRRDTENAERKEGILRVILKGLVEAICKHLEYLGKRIKRGLFRAVNGILTNAYMNGSPKIISRSIPKDLYRWDIVAIRIANFPKNVATDVIFCSALGNDNT
ncbi:hypothetical protein A4S05_33750 [Nostoc sp. KVJ20]|nr:hypothetical protein A4S05_33750 [Nostoc sp. KVJ20]